MSEEIWRRMDEIIEKIIDDADEWFNVVEGDIDARDYTRRLVSEGIKAGQEIEKRNRFEYLDKWQKEFRESQEIDKEHDNQRNDWRRLCDHTPKCFYGTEHIVKVINQSKKEVFDKVKNIMERHINNPGVWKMNQQEALEIALEEMEDNLGKELK